MPFSRKRRRKVPRGKGSCDPSETAEACAPGNAEPQLGKEGFADEDPLAKLGLGVPREANSITGSGCSQTEAAEQDVER